MNRSQIIAVLGLLALEACSAADEGAERPVADAGRDVKTTSRPDAAMADQLDASGGSDAGETSTPPEPDAAEPDTISPPPDVSDPRPDAVIPPPDSAKPPPIDASPPPPVDAPPDVMLPTCTVTFTVSGVHWDAPEGGTTDAQVPGRVVRLVGDGANIGSWTPTAGVLLTEITSGTWTGTANFRDQQVTEFKFVKLEGVTSEWENWLPYDSNRSLRVECFDDAGVLRDATDAATDATTSHDVTIDAKGGDAPASNDVNVDMASSDGAGDVDLDSPAVGADSGTQDAGAPSDGRVVPVPAHGRSYVGAFSVRPADATK